MSKILKEILKAINADESIADNSEMDDQSKIDAINAALRLKMNTVANAQVEIKVKDAKKEGLTEGYQMAERKIKENISKTLSEKLGVSEIDNLENFLNTDLEKLISEKPSSSDFKTNAEFLTLEREWKTKIKTALKEKEEAVTAIEQTYKTKEAQNIARKKIIQEFEKLNPVLSADATKAQAQKDLFVSNVMNKYGFKTTDTGDLQLTDKDGKVLEDEMFNQIKIDKIVADNAAALYDFQKDDGRGSPHGSTNAGGNSSSSSNPNFAKYKGKMPENEKELMGIMENSEIALDAKNEVYQAWSERQSKAN